MPLPGDVLPCQALQPAAGVGDENLLQTSFNTHLIPIFTTPPLFFFLSSRAVLLAKTEIRCDVFAQCNTAISKGLLFSPLKLVGVLLLISIGTRHFCAFG